MRRVCDAINKDIFVCEKRSNIGVLVTKMFLICHHLEQGSNEPGHTLMPLDGIFVNLLDKKK